ncbi:MAG: hypothetical protein NTY19_51175 [Planctomycetota bacterium]|nr:hypothetical protein [Planctomycetota bacterium]
MPQRILPAPVEQHGLSFVVQYQGGNRQGIEYFLENLREAGSWCPSVDVAVSPATA